ncbi:thioredoxin family protein [Dinghuibacter silviterrae]|uniref:Thioredoxin-like protein n=1 Tax=Dinghuibacter silviterrae TaxID=1539049 RepID=A0A4R8DNZ8_9BACT|nr:thioredoxin family protein [Dinghuibacter silviterrae]TDW99144.1 thioredoxin-like protein [Dinghuibacter silviterrae]
MKRYVLLACVLGVFGALQAQDLSTFHAYHPEEDAAAGLQRAVKSASAAHKNVFVEIGGNWCVWCARFAELSGTDHQIDSALNTDFVVLHVNFSKENMNLPLMARLGYPQRFGFPVFVIVNDRGTVVHIQNSEYLEQGKGYNKKMILSFLDDWSPRALDPASY